MYLFLSPKSRHFLKLQHTASKTTDARKKIPRLIFQMRTDLNFEVRAKYRSIIGTNSKTQKSTPPIRSPPMSVMTQTENRVKTDAPINSVIHHQN
ncbi:hypothetical protein TNCV_1273941 [Trichonephila clavipes]|nr:hypothetical protein TNCV_1273941 [Trichonephila clavipes]